MKTAMQELRDDLVKSLETGNEALNEITDEKLREICQKVAQLTLESIIKRIDEELLEMEKEQMFKVLIKGTDVHRAYDIELEFKEWYNETFKQQEQTEL